VQKRLNRSICCLVLGGPKEAHVQPYLPGGANVPDDTLLWAVQKWLNRSIGCFGGGLGWAEGSTIFYRVNQVAPMCPYGRAQWCHTANTTVPSICGGDAALYQLTLTTCQNFFSDTFSTVLWHRFSDTFAFSALTLLVGWQEGHPASKKWGDGGGNWLVRMEWRPTGWSMCLPLLIFPCTINSKSSLWAPAHPGGPGNKAIKFMVVCESVCVCVRVTFKTEFVVSCLAKILLHL